MLFGLASKCDQPLVVVEVGTSKIAVIVGEQRNDGSIVISGFGRHDSSGVRKSEVMDYENASRCLRLAISAAENMSDIDIRNVRLVFSGGRPQSVTNRSSLQIPNAAIGINLDDIEEVAQLAKAVHIDEDREVIHSINQHFYLDDKEPVDNPEGLFGQRLALDMLILHVNLHRVHNTVQMIRDLGIDVVDVAFAGLYAALVVVTPEQKENGVLVIDLGGGTTDYVAYANNIVAAVGSLAVGGDHITNDISTAFRITTKQAEALKRDAGSCQVDTTMNRRRVDVASGDVLSKMTVNQGALNTVINARMVELFGIIKDQLESERIMPHIGTGVVLTGGGAHLRGVDALARQVFGLPCAIGCPLGVTGQGEVTEVPDYAAPIGMVRNALRTGMRQGKASLFERIWRGIGMG